MLHIQKVQWSQNVSAHSSRKKNILLYPKKHCDFLINKDIDLNFLKLWKAQMKPISILRKKHIWHELDIESIVKPNINELLVTRFLIVAFDFPVLQRCNDIISSMHWQNFLLYKVVRCPSVWLFPHSFKTVEPIKLKFWNQDSFGFQFVQ